MSIVRRPGSAGSSRTVRALSGAAVGVLGVALLIGSAPATGVTAEAATGVRVTQRTLPPLPGDATSMAFDVNNHGVAVGASIAAPSTDHAVVWRGGSVTQLPGTQGLDSAAFGVNDRGVVVGRVGSLAALWRADRLVMLRTLPGGTRSQAEDVSDLGVVVGWSDDATGQSLPVWWYRGRIHVLPLPTGRLGGTALGISEHGLIGGSAGDAVIWKHGSLRVLAAPSGATGAQVLGLNDSGRAVGLAIRPDAADDLSTYPVVWRWGAPRYLPGPGDITAGAAVAVNRWNTSVGWVMVDGLTRPALWRQGTYLELGQGPAQALGINDEGLVVGWAPGGATLWRIR